MSLVYWTNNIQGISYIEVYIKELPDTKWYLQQCIVNLKSFYISIVILDKDIYNWMSNIKYFSHGGKIINPVVHRMMKPHSLTIGWSLIVQLHDEALFSKNRIKPHFRTVGESSIVQQNDEASFFNSGITTRFPKSGWNLLFQQ